MTDIIELAEKADAGFMYSNDENYKRELKLITFSPDELTKFAQLLQQGEAVGISEKVGVMRVQSNGKVAVDLNFDHWDDYSKDHEYHLFTTPPDTQQKLDKAREALQKCEEAMAWELGGEPLPTLMIEARALAQQALKDIT